MSPRVVVNWLAPRSCAAAVTLLLSVSSVSGAQQPDESAGAPARDDVTDAENEPDEADLDADGSIDDASGSIEDATATRGWNFSGDVRTLYSYSEVDDANGTVQDDDLLQARWRLAGTLGITERLRVVARIAGICSTEHCDANFSLDPEIPTSNGIADGDVTIDELFLHMFQTDRFNSAIGRLQTKFVARGGVFAKSLDRNDSSGSRVNWTDGFHGTLQIRRNWVSHLILQYNSDEGASTVRRAPLDFSDDDTRISYFVAWENVEPRGLLLQRGLDISYLPKSLLVDGTVDGRREDYLAIVARAAGRWPQRSQGRRLRLSAELGYAPETQTRAAAGLAGDGEVDGWAWNVTASFMDFLPRHSIGINYGRTDPGWLLSPQYGDNEELFEIRYLWRLNQRFALDIRARWRKDIEQLVTADRKMEDFDFFVRFTWGFEVDRTIPAPLLRRTGPSTAN